MLFPNEKLNLSEATYKNSEVPFLTSDQINEKYKKGEVRIVTEQARYPLNTIVNLVESDDYILNPEFQRRHRWDNTRKSKLIESFIMNVPIPPIFLYEFELMCAEKTGGFNLVNYRHSSGVYHEQETEDLHPRI